LSLSLSLVSAFVPFRYHNAMLSAGSHEAVTRIHWQPSCYSLSPAVTHSIAIRSYLQPQRALQLYHGDGSKKGNHVEATRKKINSANLFDAGRSGFITFFDGRQEITNQSRGLDNGRT
jgi:hypothetical protein